MCSHFEVMGICIVPGSCEVWNLGLSVYHPKRTSDWDGGREAGRNGCGQARKENFAIIVGACVWFIPCSSSTFLQVHKICNRLIFNVLVIWPGMETFIYHHLARLQRAMLPWDGFLWVLSIWFLYFSEST